jgi:hypothetical protein
MMIQGLILQDLAQNPVFTISGFVIGLLGLVLAIIFFIKSRRFKAIKFTVSSRTLVENLRSELDGLEVSYKQVPQERITVSKVYIWNNGTDTIRDSDLTEISPFRLNFDGGAQLLDARIIFSTEPSNKFLIDPPNFPTDAVTGTFLNMSFDYLDRLEGVTLQLVHTGSTKQKIILEGKIKGARPISGLRNVSLPLKSGSFFFNQKFEDWVILVGYGCVSIGSIVAVIRGYSAWLYLLGLFSLFAVSVAVWSLFRTKLPKGFSD